MIQQITKGIKISVQTSFEGTFYKDRELRFAFGYMITIENQSKDSVQLVNRHWQINDSLHATQIIEGEGVVGQKPVIKPGMSHTYRSGCQLKSTTGMMKGYYEMISFTTSRKFRVAIPTFKLCANFALN
jgi:ApaG protein